MRDSDSSSLLGSPLVPRGSLGTKRRRHGLICSRHPALRCLISVHVRMLVGSTVVLLVQIRSPGCPRHTTARASGLDTGRRSLEPPLPRPEGPCGLPRPPSHGTSRRSCVQRPTPGSRVAWSRLIQMILGRFPDKAKYFACFEPKLRKMVKDKVTELQPRCCVFSAEYFSSGF